MTVTINDIAERANVSKSVVSVVLSRTASTVRVSEKTKEHILKIAKEMNYEPNIQAKGLYLKKSFLLGFVFSADSGWEMSTRMLRGIQDGCLARDYSLVVYPSISLEEERRHLLSAWKRRVDGIIVFPFQDDDGTNTNALRDMAQKLPVVQLFLGILPECPVVERDNRQMIHDAVRYLRERGHSRIGFVTYSNYTDIRTGPSSYFQAQAYLDIMRSSGLPSRIYPVISEYEDHSRISSAHKSFMIQCSYQAAEGIAKSDYAPTAVIASSNSLAYGVCLFMKDHGKTIPDDLSVLSCSNDFIMPELILPELTVFPVDADVIGRQGVELCLNHDNASQTASAYLVPQKLQEGKSVRTLKMNYPGAEHTADRESVNNVERPN